ncbi:hypothetical protein [aff. Roholtiella sp. LEGE 12411]|uniref:hypothetical protein n=1 Tax=aff. Roholtiella sp. LEGE 12411 TaxID=1828822 RepID=UPI00187FD504|nr:hypothetical protein [aff. Roholtiella sp. LEGE 12411]MBE9037023.1 hypothetical protein [aff. Roholtiella sp. LEGE 12411]
MQNRCTQNRKRSKRRPIYCPIHRCYLHSVSQKYNLYASGAGQLQERGIGRHRALILMVNKTTVSLQGEWLEAFWCGQCEQTKWYHVKKCDRTYEVSVASVKLWQQASGVIDPEGNPSVGEFTRTQARMAGNNNSRNFR